MILINSYIVEPCTAECIRFTGFIIEYSLSKVSILTWFYHSIWIKYNEFHGEALCQFVYMGVYTLSGKPRWACAMCGMYSSRKYSVKRHISNLHNGIVNIVSFIDYIAGRRQGVYFPNPIPNYLMKQSQIAAASTTRPADVMKDEIFRTVLRKRLGYL